MSDSLNAKIPLGLQLELQQLQRKQALADALMQKAMTPNVGQMVGQHYVAPSAMSSIGAPIIEALMANKLQGRNAEISKALAEQYKGQQNRMSAKDIFAVPGASLESRRAAALANAGEGDLSLLTPDQREHIVNGQVITTTPGQAPQRAGDFRDTYAPVAQVGTDENGKPLMGQAERTTGEVKFAPRGQTVNVDTTLKAGEKFAGALAEERAKAIKESYTNAQSASKAYDAMAEARKDLDAGIVSGSLANVNLGLTKFAKALGLNADPSIVNTEAFKASMARETLNLVKSLGSGTGISNADREFAAMASGGEISLDAGAMQRLINIASAAAGNVLVGHQRLLDSNAGATGALPQDLETFKVPFAIGTSKPGTPAGLTFDEPQMKFGTSGPAPAAAPPKAPMTFDEWYKSRKGAR